MGALSLDYGDKYTSYVVYIEMMLLGSVHGKFVDSKLASEALTVSRLSPCTSKFPSEEFNRQGCCSSV